MEWNPALLIPEETGAHPSHFYDCNHSENVVAFSIMPMTPYYHRQTENTPDEINKILLQKRILHTDVDDAKHQEGI